jgi:catechol 2,3-dioxygenase-like lactoylglutathione lyase family enzyme
MRISYVMVFVGEMNRSVAFYRHTLGLPLRFESTDWTEFATEGAASSVRCVQGAESRVRLARGAVRRSGRAGLLGG